MILISGTDSTKTIEWKFGGNEGNAMFASRLLEECSLTEGLVGAHDDPKALSKLFF